MLRLRGLILVRLVSEILKILIISVTYFCVYVEQVYAVDGVNQPIIQNNQEVFDGILNRSSQVIVGRFDLLSIGDINELKPEEPVEIKFFIERRIKGVDSSIDSIDIPIPYEFFVLRAEEGMEKFRSMMLKHRQQLSIKEHAFLRGELNETDWLIYKNESLEEFRSHKHKLLMFNAINRGLDMSFNSDVRYVLFLQNYFDGDHIDWKYTLSQRTFSLGSGTFADLLLEE